LPIAKPRLTLIRPHGIILSSTSMEVICFHRIAANGLETIESTKSYGGKVRPRLKDYTITKQGAQKFAWRLLLLLWLGLGRCGGWVWIWLRSGCLCRLFLYRLLWWFSVVHYNFLRRLCIGRLGIL
jgi:hypothetical protein